MLNGRVSFVHSCCGKSLGNMIFRLDARRAAAGAPAIVRILFVRVLGGKSIENVGGRRCLKHDWMGQTYNRKKDVNSDDDQGNGFHGVPSGSFIKKQIPFPEFFSSVRYPSFRCMAKYINGLWGRQAFNPYAGIPVKSGRLLPPCRRFRRPVSAP